jgi:hypothetical protein
MHVLKTFIMCCQAIKTSYCYLLAYWLVYHNPVAHIGRLPASACSLDLSATSQQYFSLRTNQPPATSNQPAVLFSQNKPAPAISHQPNDQASSSIPFLPAYFIL